MTMQSIPLSRLMPTGNNPRSDMDEKSIAGLAASIRTDGLLQNLVVAPATGKKKGRYWIVSGERRFQALRLLQKGGDIEADHAVPVEIRDDLTDDDILRLATVENVQRENLPPLDEAAAFAGLLRDGVTLADLAAKTGLSEGTIRRRLALNSLCDEAKDLVRQGEISLSQAEALTLGSEAAQQELLENIGNYSADEIREILLDCKPTLSDAIFPKELYKGEIISDLFQEDSTSYFGDVDQFMKLQKEAVATLAAKHKETALWVEVTNDLTIRDWQYRKTRAKKAGVLINLSPSGSVEIREGLAKSEIDPETAKASVAAPARMKAAYPSSLCRYIAAHKSAAVQRVLLENPRKAKEVSLLRVLQWTKPHASFGLLEKSGNPQAAYATLEAVAAGFGKKLRPESDSKDPAWKTLPEALQYVDDLDLYEAIKALSDEDLEALLSCLCVMSFGQETLDRLDASESLFNRVATDLGVDMRLHWKPDTGFLDRRNRAQLFEIAKESGYADQRSLLESAKKTELVMGLTRHFAEGAQWLPEVMHFPAVNPDAAAMESGDDQPEDETDA